MKLSEFKVGDKVRFPTWGKRAFIEILGIGQNVVLGRDEHGEEGTWSGRADAELYTPPKKTKRVAPCIATVAGELFVTGLFPSKDIAKKYLGRNLVSFPAKLVDGTELWFEVPEE